MTAFEIFKQLGYKQELRYRKLSGNSLGDLEYIIYYHDGVLKELQQAFCFGIDGFTFWTTRYEDLFSDDGRGEIFGVSAEEVLAIIQQMKELGWIKWDTS